MSPEWKEYKDGDIVTFQDNTAAILVEVSKTSAQIRIYRVEPTFKYLKTVAPYQYKRHTAIVPWEEGLEFHCYGEDDYKNALKLKIGIIRVAPK